MLMLEEALARVQTTLDVETLRLTIAQDDRQLIVADLSDEAARAKVEEIFWQLVPALRSAPTLVRSPDGHFMDKPDNVISLINLATVRSLEQQWGIKIDPLRFRANLYIDGARPWEEFEWVGSDIRIGDVVVSRRPPQRPVRRHQRQSRKPAEGISICRVRCAPPSATRNSGFIWSRGRADAWPQAIKCHAVPSGATLGHAPLPRCEQARNRPAEVHVRRVLFHLRAGRRPAGSIDPPRDAVRRDPGELAMPRLRNRENHVPSARRAAAFHGRHLRRTAENRRARETDLRPAQYWWHCLRPCARPAP